MAYSSRNYSNRATQYAQPTPMQRTTQPIIQPREGEIKKATYRIKNDSGVYDTVYFSTSAEQVVESEEQQFVSSAKKTQYDENTIYNNPMATVSALGGIAAGTSFVDMPVREVLDKLLYPYVAPTVSTTSTPNGGTFEVGSTQNVTSIRVIVGKKSERITSIKVFDGSTQLGAKVEAEVQNGGTFDFPVSISVTTNKSFKAEVTDASGQVYNKTTGAFNFVYPYHWGVVDEGTVVDAAVVAGLTKKVEGKSNKSVTVTADNQRVVFAYPSSHGAIKQILDPNNFDVTGTFGRETVTMPNGQQYYVYVNSAFTASNFTFRFNY